MHVLDGIISDILKTAPSESYEKTDFKRKCDYLSLLIEDVNIRTINEKHIFKRQNSHLLLYK